MCTCGKTDIAPAGIMNDHVHEKGNWMISYQYMRMNMQNNIMGDQRISDNDIFTKYNYSMSPSKMTMDMHMIMIMYGVSDRFTMMAMTSYNTASMNMNMFSTGRMQMPGMTAEAAMPNSQSISGFGDTRLYGLYSIAKNDDIQIVGTMGLNIPTGSINKLAFPEVYKNLRADYIMQPGTGTVDFLPGISLLMLNDGFDWGAQVSGIIRPFYNTNGYHYGNEGIVELWAAKKWTSWLSSSIRIEAIADGSMAGSDANLYTLMEPSADAANYGGFKADIYPGINFYPGTFLSADIKLRLEYGLPLYQFAREFKWQTNQQLLQTLICFFNQNINHSQKTQ